MPTLEQWRSFYDSWAGRDPRLASTGRPTSEAEFARLGATLASWLQLDGDERALDVGCAAGMLTSQWAPRAAAVVGVDFSARLVEEARQRHGGERLDFQVAEAAALPFADGSFDAVVCFNVLLSLPDHDYVGRALDEIVRVAKPRATLLLGSLPDERCQQRFFEVLLQEAPWPRRVLSALRRRLGPPRERSTKILWFDLDAVVARLADRGFTTELHDDPPFANYRHYRKTIVARRDGSAR